MSLRLNTPVECVWAADSVLGEGPVWVDAQQSLFWVDVKMQNVHRLTPETGASCTYHMCEPIGACLPAIDGRFLCALKNGLALVDLPPLQSGGCHEVSEADLERFEGPETGPGRNRFNDAKVDDYGRLWAGTMDDEETDPTGVLYRINWDRHWSNADDGYIITNGPAFSVDGQTLYHTNTIVGEIYSFHLDRSGNLSDKRLHISIPKQDGYPDGMTVDAENCLWVAHFGGSRLTRFDPAGDPVCVLPLPVANVTSCTFGGPDHDKLFITTARWTLDEEALRGQPLAGGLFVAEPGCRGLPTVAFGAL